METESDLYLEDDTIEDNEVIKFIQIIHFLIF